MRYSISKSESMENGGFPFLGGMWVFVQSEEAEVSHGLFTSEDKIDHDTDGQLCALCRR